MALPLVLLPGMMCDARLFLPQVAALSAGRAVLCADLSRDGTVPAMAARVLAEAPPVFALAGLSLGGIVAMEMLHQAPGRIARLALMDTNPLAEAPEIRAGRADQIARAMAGGLEAMMADTVIPRYLARPDAPPDHPPDHPIAALCLEMARALGPEVFRRQSLALRDRADRTEALRGADCPALILNGAHDRMCPPERHALMHRLMPRARRVEIAGAGHLPVLETPDATNEALRSWLTS